MSRERRRIYIMEQRDDGTTRMHTQRHKGAPSLGAIPRRDRVVDVLTTNEELLATCVQLGEALGVVTARGPSLGPMYLLLDDGRLYLSRGNDDGTLSAMGTGWESVHLYASDKARWKITAADMTDATRRARPGRPARTYAIGC